MTEDERKYYEKLKSNRNDYNFDKLFFIDQNDIVQPNEGVWFRLIGDIPMFESTSQMRIDLEKSTINEIDNHPLNKIRSNKTGEQILDEMWASTPFGDPNSPFFRDRKKKKEKKLEIQFYSCSEDNDNYNFRFIITNKDLDSRRANFFIDEINKILPNATICSKTLNLGSMERTTFDTKVSIKEVKKLNPNFEFGGFEFKAFLMCDGLSAETNKFVISTKTKVAKDDFIIVEGIKYNYDEIKKRVENIEKKLKIISTKLTIEDKTILNLPLLEWKLGFRYGAVMTIHWLEATKKSIKLDYKFFISEKRLTKIDLINLKNYFEHLKYLCEENFGYSPSNPDGNWLFLFNDSIPAIRKSKDLFLKQISTLNGSTKLGDYENLSKHIDEKPIVKNNLFQSFDIGSKTGDLDDVGATLGRFSLRCYFKGIVNKNDQNNGIKWFFNIDEIAVRFVDEFSFNDPKKEFFGPGTWFSQSLGYWKNDLNNPDVSRDASGLTIDDTYIELTNEKFIILKEKAKKAGVTIGGDFLIYSDIKKISDEFVKKSILVY